MGFFARRRDRKLRVIGALLAAQVDERVKAALASVERDDAALFAALDARIDEAVGELREEVSDLKGFKLDAQELIDKALNIERRANGRKGGRPPAQPAEPAGPFDHLPPHQRSEAEWAQRRAAQRRAS